VAKNERVYPDIGDIQTEFSFFYENAFYLTSDPRRLAKLLVHYELFKRAMDMPGDIVECGVFKGTSFSRFVKFRNIFESSRSKRVIGFDIFGKFPPDETLKEDVVFRKRFIDEAGEKSISRRALMKFLEKSNAAENILLIKGDVSKTIPDFLNSDPGLRISLINIDVDLYKPTRDCLHYLYGRVSPGGVLILDDYHGFPGATKAIDEFFSDKPHIKIEKYPWTSSPYYVVKR